MTTLAYKEGVLAADKRITDDQGGIHGSMTKCVKTYIGGPITNRHLVGVNGNLTGSQEFIRNVLEKGFEEAIATKLSYSFKKDECIVGIAISEDSACNKQGCPIPIIYFHSREGILYSDVIYTKIAASGSGTDYALGAMQAGENSTEAVRIASMFDTSTGGEIDAVFF